MRALLAALAALFIVAGTASAADLIGGTLTAGGTEAILTSTATIPVEVIMTGSDVTVTPSRFTLDPGQTVHMSLAGPDVGTLSAHLAVLTPIPGTDAASVTLQVNLKAATPPPGVPWGTVALGLLLAAGVALAVRRLRPWELRVSRSGPMG